jgi:AcrR family transcriptional regulator
LTTRSIAQGEKRRLILDAAVKVFARRGYHGSRVGDIAEQAGIAHGLLYHYFGSKQEVLETLFRENWRELVERFRAVAEVEGEPATEKLSGIAKILLRTWRNNPDLVTVMIREVARTPHLASQIEDIDVAFELIRRIIAEGQARGELRGDLDPRLAAFVFYGGMEEILTGWVLGTLADGDEEVARAERAVLDIAIRGLAAPAA